MSVSRIFAMATLLCAASACQVAPRVHETANWTLPEGATLNLRRDVEVPAGWARATFQDGESMHPNDIDHKLPACGLFLSERSPRGEPFTVSADSFATGDVHRPFPDLILESRRTFVTKVPLDSPRQPLVVDLICEITGDPRWVGHLSLDEVRAALGDSFELLWPGGE